MLQPLALHPRRGVYRYVCGAAGEHASLDPARVAFESRCDRCVERMSHLLDAMPDQQLWWHGPAVLVTREQLGHRIRRALRPAARAAS